MHLTHLLLALGLVQAGAWSTLARADAESDQLQSEHDDRVALQALRQQQINQAQSDQASLQEQQNSLDSAIAGSTSDLANAQAHLAQNQSALSSANATLSAATQAQSQAQQDIVAAQTQLQTAQTTAATQTARLSDAQQQLAAAQAQVASTNAEVSTQKETLSRLGSESNALQAVISANSSAVASSAPALQRLAIQSGILSNGSRSCSATMTGTSTLRTAAHCIQGLLPADVQKLRFTNGAGSVTPVAAIAATDPGHDAAFLTLAVADNAFLDVSSLPLAGPAVRLLAYSQGTQVATLSDECHILSIDLAYGMVRHDCQSGPGASGGALIQNGAIVAIHIGKAGTQGVASFVDPSTTRSYDFPSVPQLTLEYNCDSNCQAEASHSLPFPCPTLTNPRRQCHHDVVDPATLNLCESMRGSDCSARAAAQDLARLKDTLNHQNYDLAISIFALTDKLNAITPGVDALRHSVTEKQSQLEGLRNSVAAVSAQAANIATSSAQAAAAATTASHATAVLRQTQQSILNARDSTLAAAGNTANQVAALKSTIATQVSAQTAATADLSDVTTKVAAASQQRLITAQQAAASRTVVTLAAVVAPAPIVAAAVAPYAAKQVEQVSDRMANLGKKAAKWGDTRSAALVHTLVYRIAPKIRVSVGRYYERTSAWLAIHDPTRLHTDKVYAGRLRTLNRCLDRATAAMNAYKTDLQTLGLRPLLPGTLTLAQIATDHHALNADEANLTEALAEVKANNCNVTGMDQPLSDALIDTGKWQDWLDAKRVDLTASH